MQGPTGERWKQLCEQAAVEQDSQRLLELFREINRLLEEKQNRLKSKELGSESGSAPSVPKTP